MSTHPAHVRLLGGEALGVQASHPEVVDALLQQLVAVATEAGAPDPAAAASDALRTVRAMRLQKSLDELTAAARGIALERLRQEQAKARWSK
jgi:hypothetical protein